MFLKIQNLHLVEVACQLFIIPVWVRRETVPPPHLKYKLTKGFLMQSGAQIVVKHVHIVYLQCIYSFPCSPYMCVPPSGTQMQHEHSHMITSHSHGWGLSRYGFLREI